MHLFTKTLFLCLALAVTDGAPGHHRDAVVEDGHALPDRCDGLEFDAIAPDEKGTTFFFKGPYLWKGFYGPAHFSNETFKELDDLLHSGHVDAAFRKHHKDNPGDHDHIYLFQGDKVFSYYDYQLEDGYPMNIEDKFPGVPCHLDAAIECPKGECMVDSVLFFKGHDVYVYDLTTKSVKSKVWSHLPLCTSAYRWLGNYYCFHGNNFTRFDPLSGEVNGTYPKDARNYFMKCPNFGHGGGQHKVPKCSELKIDAITADDAGKTYYFAGAIYMRLDTPRDGRHYFPIRRTWPQVTNGVDAVFSHADKIYMIKDDQVYIYKSVAQYTLIKGYPKTLKEELGIEGHVDAAFVCPNDHIVHIIKDNHLLSIDLTATPRTMTNMTMPVSNIDGAMCDAKGIDLFQGSHYYHYVDPMHLVTSKISPFLLNITSEMMGCEDDE